MELNMQFLTQLYFQAYNDPGSAGHKHSFRQKNLFEDKLKQNRKRINK